MFQEKYNEQQLQVLILADQFTPELDYLKLDEASWAFKRFHIFQFIDLCLEWVTWLESPRVIVAFANQPDKIAQQLQQKWVKNFMDLQVLTFQKCHSANDVLREVETRGLLSGDFLLVYNCATFCSSNLTTQIKNFRILKRQNKNSVATLLFTEQSDEEMQNSGPLVAFESSSKKIVHFDPHSHRRGKVRMPKTAFLVGTSFRSDLAPCGLMLCTAEFRCHFAGNYDFHSLDAILQDILSNEEFLGQQFHLDIVDDQQALCIRNVPAIFDVHAKLLQRKCFPLSFDNVFPNLKASNDIDHLELCSKERNIYSPAGAFSEDKLQNEKLQDVVFGRNCQLGSGSAIERVSFEINAKIGSDVLLQDVICGKGVQIGDGVKIESSILGNNVTIGSGAVLGRNCLLGDGVEVAFLVIYCIGMNGAKAKVFAGTTVGSGTFLQRGKTPSKWMAIEEDRGEVSSEEEEDETGKRERAKETEPVDVTYQGNSRAFISEVLESMQAIQEATSESRGEKDDQVSAKKFSISGEQVEHLKLEINASKLAYNISLEELPRLLFLAFLRLLGPDHRLSAFTEMFKGWSPLWDVFFKKAATKMGMLHAIEEFAGENAPFRRIVPNVLHWLSQDQEFLDDDQILTWHTALPSDSPLHDLPKLTELIEWLQQEEEESE